MMAGCEEGPRGVSETRKAARPISKTLTEFDFFHHWVQGLITFRHPCSWPHTSDPLLLNRQSRPPILSSVITVQESRQECRLAFCFWGLARQRCFATSREATSPSTAFAYYNEVWYRYSSLEEEDRKSHDSQIGLSSEGRYLCTQSGSFFSRSLCQTACSRNE